MADALACMAQEVIKLQQTGTSITADQVKELLKDVKGTTFASMLTVTKVKLAAANKDMDIFKVTSARVQLFNNIHSDTSVYANAVKRSAAKDESNNQENVQNFEVQENYFEHTDCYSVVRHKADHTKLYLYAIYNGAESVYVHGDKILTKAQVATYCTPAEAKKLLDPEPTYNVGNQVAHSVVPRALKLESIIQLRAMKQTLEV